MKLVIDFQGAQACNSQRGIGRYSREIISEICKNHTTEFDIHLLFNGAFLSEGISLKNNFTSLVPKSNLHTFFPCCDPSKKIMDTNDRRRTEVVRDTLLNSINPDIVFITSLFEGLVDNAVTNVKSENSNYKTAVILYDLIPLLNPQLYLKSRKSKLWYRERIEQLKKNDCILTISEYTKKTAVEYLDISEKKIFNISGAVDHTFFSSSQKKTKENFIFTVSGMDPRKNLNFLIEAYAKSISFLKTNYKLVITCNMTEDVTDQFRRLISELKLSKEQVSFTGHISDQELLEHYRNCSLFIFPSWQEGFGLPVLEAMACGAPVLAANTASLPEIGGESLVYFDPFDGQDLTNKIVSLLSDPNLLFSQSSNNSMLAKSFTWSKVAKKSVNAIKATIRDQLKKTNVQNVFNKPTLAYVSPMPPDRTGIAEYSEILSKELAKYYNVTVVASSKSYQRRRIQGLMHLDTEKFLSSEKSFDRVFYHFGNSHFHVEMFDFLSINPGVSVLHDFFLGGVVGIRSDQNSLIYKNHGYRAIKRIIETTESDFSKDHPINLSVFQDSLGVIVHSDYALNLAKKWYGSDITEKTSVVPLFRSKTTKLLRNEARKELKIDQDQFVVATFGHLGPNKLNDRLLESWLSSPLAKSGRLVFVGQVGNSSFDNILLKKIKTINDEMRVHCTGWVSKKDYLTWLSCVDVAVQLRANTRGETSAAALDCLSYSIPTIVNAHGDLKSLPKNSVTMIADKFSDLELRQAIEELHLDHDYRKRLSTEGNLHVSNNHNIVDCGLAYYKAIESYYESETLNVERIFRFLKSKNYFPKNHIEKVSLVNSLATSLDSMPKIKKYFIDISELVNRDARTGIQRVVRNILRCMLINPPKGYLVEPVYATNESKGYLKATRFVEGFLKLPSICKDEPIDPNCGDIFLGLDLQPKVVTSQKKYLDMMYLKGVSVHFLVYDLIPINFPKFFPDGAQEIFHSWLETVSNYDQLLCISNSTKLDVEKWLKNYYPCRFKLTITRAIRLSNELNTEDRTLGDPKNGWFVRYLLEHHEVFLMVGTLEPRKEHFQVVAAFEMLWDKGCEKKLVIVGKRGWCVDDLAKKIKNHQQLNKNLIWLEDCSDEFLLELYSGCKGLIAASWAEGFGLPLIEAFNSGLPVFCRDIPVFREVADKFATFFSASEPKIFLNQFLEWESSINRSSNVKSESVQSICWKKATKELQNVTVKND